MKVKPKRVAALARSMGIRTPISHNFALALGGLRQGVTPWRRPPSGSAKLCEIGVRMPM